MIAIVNPCGGRRRGRAIFKRVRSVFDAAGIAVDAHVTDCAGHARRLASELPLEGCDGVCVVGGDGTVHEVADGLLARGEPRAGLPPLGLIPAGSGNAFCEHLGCVDPAVAAERIIAGQSVPLDALQLRMGDETCHCVNIVGWGAAVDINHMAENLRLFGPARYSLSALAHVALARRRPARVTLDGQTHEDEFFLVMACNTKFTGKGMKLAPRAEIGDGLVDVVVVRRASRWQMLQMFAKIYDGAHLVLPCVEYHQVRSLSIDSPGGEPLDVDGENKGRVPASVEVLPGALRVFA